MKKISYNLEDNDNISAIFDEKYSGEHIIEVSDEIFDKIFIEHLPMRVEEGKLVENTSQLEINELQNQILELQRVNQEQQNIINTYLVRLVQESSIFSNVEKEALWSMVDRFDEATLKEIELHDLMYPDEVDLAEWKKNRNYLIGDKFTYNGFIYKVIQEHTSQETWKPDLVPSLYTRIGTIEQATEIKDWKQPVGSHDAYQIGDKVKFNNKIYESVINNNTWSPSVYPAGWKLLGDA